MVFCCCLTKVTVALAVPEGKDSTERQSGFANDVTSHKTPGLLNNSIAQQITELRLIEENANS